MFDTSYSENIVSEAILEAALEVQRGHCYTQYEAIAAASIRIAVDKIIPLDMASEDVLLIRDQFLYLATRLEKEL